MTLSALEHLARAGRQSAPIRMALAACAVAIFAGSAAAAPFWHVGTFNAANLSGTSGNHAMWSGVPSGTPGYATAPGYGNNWDDRLYWRGTVASPTTPTQVRLRFIYNHDLQPGADFLRVEHQSGASFVLRAQVSGSNKNTSGQFVTPAVFDQTWTVSPAEYGGPNHDQIVLRLRVLTNPSASDQDGAYNSSGAVQVDDILVALDGVPVSNADFEPTGDDGGWTPFDRQAVAEYVRDNILGGTYGGVSLWMTQQPVDPTHIARDRDPTIPNLAMPYPLTWVVVIDDFPNANWAHPCRWLAVNADLTAHSGPLNRQMPPTVWGGGGTGPQVDIGCTGLTPAPCPSLEVPPSIGGLVPGPEGPCLHAVMIEGGVSEAFNYSIYTVSMRNMYRKLRELGFAKENIHVFFEDGSPRDFDNLDGDNDHDTGSDVEGAADQTAIRERISGLCDTLDPRKDVLFIYTTDHGIISALQLWDFSGDGLTTFDEEYAPDELGLDTRHCRVCRQFVLMDQCYSGAFIPRMTDEYHRNTAIYTAATDDETSTDREYLNVWEDLDVAGSTMNALHAAVLASGDVLYSHPQTGEGTPGVGDHVLNDCCALENCYLPAVTPLCADDAAREVGLVICNLRDEQHSYDLAFAGDPVDSAAGCTIAGPTGFTVLDPTPVVVPAGACVRVRVRIDRPAGMNAMFETACYTATVTSRERGNSFTCHGSLVDERVLCAGWLIGSDPFFSPKGQPRTVRVRLTNTGTSGAEIAATTLPYQFSVTPSEFPVEPNTIVGLNGLPPGTPVTGVIQRPSPGGSVEIPVTFEHVQTDREFFYDLRFMADTDGDGQQETLTSLGLRQSPDGTVAVATPPPGPRRLRVTPNPIAGAAEIAFALEGPGAAPVRLDVTDLLGRRVRTLVPGTLLAPGLQRVVWNGADESGRRLPSGIYWVRLLTPRRVETAKVVVMWR